MANVLLTTNCNLRCPYCFAQERLADRGDRQMSRESFEYAVAFLKKSDHPIVRLMGGEPTLHPNFREFVQLAFREGMQVDVLSNATWGEETNAFFERIAPGSIRFLLNIDHPDRYPDRIWSRIERNLESVSQGRNVTLSFNFFERPPRYEYLLGLIRRYRIASIRLSLSLPIFGAHNTCLTLEECKGLGASVVEVARACRELGADARLDNAVPLCMFTDAEAGELVLNRVLEPERNAKCPPVVDIGPDLTVWCCFCLSKLWNRRLEEFGNLDEILAYYRGLMAPYQGERYPLEECGTCRLRSLWGCQGGCLSYSLQKHGLDLRAPMRAELPAIPLALAPDLAIRAHDLPKQCFTISWDGRPPVEVGEQFVSVMSLVDGARTPREIAGLLLNPQGGAGLADGPVAQFARRAAAEAVDGLLRDMLRDGILVASVESGAI